MIVRTLYVIIGLLGYGFGLASLVAFMLFSGGWSVSPWKIDAPAHGSVGPALLTNCGLVALFGLQHSVMARPGFKQWWSRIVPAPIERSVYCIATGAVVFLLCACWWPLPGVVWSTDVEVLQFLLYALQIVGWMVAVASSFMINHFELFGVQQVYSHVAGKPTNEPGFTACWLYRFVRHPLQMGILLGVWTTPHMSTSHLFLSSLLSAYILIALQLEERDLAAELGEDYVKYRRRVPMLVPGTTLGTSAGQSWYTDRLSAGDAPDN